MRSTGPVTRLLLLTVLFSCLITLGIAHADEPPAQPVDAVAETPFTVQAASSATPPNCRYGVASVLKSNHPWVPRLQAGWYVTFAALPVDLPDDYEFVPVIRVKQNKSGCTYLSGYKTDPPLTQEGLGALLLERPGSLWIVGNEPDRGPTPENCQTQRVQDDTMPDVYAQAYHDAYHFIKHYDPTARVANAGLVQVTPGRLQYLDAVWQSYQRMYGRPMPVDVWNMHLYVLPETYLSGVPNNIASIALGSDPAVGKRESGNLPANCARDDVYCWAEHDDMNEFAKQVVLMRTWMAAHGQREKPLILSEYSVLYPFQDYDDPVNPTTCHLMDEYGRCFTPARIKDFLNRTLDYLETRSDPALGYPRDGNRLVQRWLWFAVMTDKVGHTSNLVTDSLTELTSIGVDYVNRASRAARTVDLYPDRVYGIAERPNTVTNTATGTLTVEIRNLGTVPPGNQTLRVSFYKDASLTQLIRPIDVPAAIRGCEAGMVRASVQWPDLSVGGHDFWVKIDSAGAVAESNETNNTARGRVTVHSHRIHLPLIIQRSPAM